MRILHVTPQNEEKLSWGNDDNDFGLTHHYLISYLINNIESQYMDNLEIKICANNIKQCIDLYAPDIVAISSLTFNFPAACSIAKYAKEKGCITIIGGHHISNLPYSLTDDMDVGILGEGEITYLELISNFLKYGLLNNLNNIAGIVYRDNGKIKINNARLMMSDLDKIGHIKRSVEYFNSSVERSLFTTRGCCYNCVFCGASSFWKNRIRYNSSDYVIKEIENIYDFSETNFIKIEDLTFTVNKKRLYEILCKWKKHPLYGFVKFAVKGRANLMDEEMGQLLHELGVDTVFFGFESNNHEVLSYLKKHDVSLEANQKAYDIVTKYGMTCYGSFIIGSPIDTCKSIEDTLHFLERNKEMYADVCNLVPLPGTVIYDYAKKSGLIDNNYFSYCSSYSKEDVKSGRYIHLSEKISRNDLLYYFDEFDKILAKRSKSSYQHKTKFRK